MEITIKDKVYKLKYTLRALFIFEQISGKMFEIKTLTDEYIYFYCLLMANNKDIDLTFNDFITELDDNPDLMKQYKEFMETELAKQSQFNTDTKPKDKKKH